MHKNFFNSINTIFISRKENYFIMGGEADVIAKCDSSDFQTIVESDNDEDIYALILDQLEAFIYFGGSQERIVKMDNRVFKTVSTYPKVHQDNIYSLVLNQMEDLIFSGGKDGLICAWSTAEESCLFKITHPDFHQINQILFDESKGRLFMCNYMQLKKSQRKGNVFQIEVSGNSRKFGEVKRLIPNCTEFIFCIDFSQEEDTIYYGGKSGVIVSQQVSSSKVHKFIGHKGVVWSLKLLKNGQMVSTGHD